MTTVLFIRHGAHVLGSETIAGRMPGVSLSELGRGQAGRLAERLGSVPIAAIYSSPVDRTRETAEIVGERLGLPVAVREGLAEIEFGEWTGRRLDELRPREEWKQWNANRAGARIPGGENILEVQARMVAEAERARAEHPEGVVALFSHGDPIKTALAYFLGSPLALLMRMEISLASVSAVRIGDYGPWVLCVNSTGEVVLG